MEKEKTKTIKGYKKEVYYNTYKLRKIDGKEQVIKTGKILKQEEKNIDEDTYLKGVTCFVINEKGEVLIEKRVNRGLTPGKLDLCSGHLDNNETPTQAMVRELKEELGILQEESMNVQKITNQEIPLQFISKGKKRNFCIDFYCLKRNNSDVKIQKEEVEQIAWVPLRKCFDLIRKGKTKFPYDETNKDKYEEIFEKVDQMVSGINLLFNEENVK